MENKSPQSPVVLCTTSFLLYTPHFILGSEECAVCARGEVTRIRGLFLDSLGCLSEAPGGGRGVCAEMTLREAAWCLLLRSNWSINLVTGAEGQGEGGRGPGCGCAGLTKPVGSDWWGRCAKRGDESLVPPALPGSESGAGDAVGLLPLLPALCPFCPFSPQFPMAESSVWGCIPASPLVTLTTSCSIS